MWLAVHWKHMNYVTSFTTVTCIIIEDQDPSDRESWLEDESLHIFK